MTNLEDFDVAKKTQSYRHDIFASLKSMLSLGLNEFSKSLVSLVGATSGRSKTQIDRSLARWEKQLQTIRQVTEPIA